MPLFTLTKGGWFRIHNAFDNTPRRATKRASLKGTFDTFFPGCKSACRRRNKLLLELKLKFMVAGRAARPFPGRYLSSIPSYRINLVCIRPPRCKGLERFRSESLNGFIGDVTRIICVLNSLHQNRQSFNGKGWRGLWGCIRAT